MRRRLKVDQQTLTFHPELRALVRPMPRGHECCFSMSQLPGARLQDSTRVAAVVLLEPGFPGAKGIVRLDSARGVAALLRSSAHQVDDSREKSRFGAIWSVMQSAVCLGSPRPENGLRDVGGLVGRLRDST
jgi:hypothetical protein